MLGYLCDTCAGIVCIQYVQALCVYRMDNTSTTCTRPTNTHQHPPTHNTHTHPDLVGQPVTPLLSALPSPTSPPPSATSPPRQCFTPSLAFTWSVHFLTTTPATTYLHCLQPQKHTVGCTGTRCRHSIVHDATGSATVSGGHMCCM